MRKGSSRSRIDKTTRRTEPENAREITLFWTLQRRRRRRWGRWRRRRGKVYSGAESPPPAPPQKSNLRNRNGVASMNRIQKSYFSNNVAIACCRKRSVIYWRESSASTHTAPYFLYGDTWHSSFLWA